MSEKKYILKIIEDSIIEDFDESNKCIEFENQEEAWQSLKEKVILYLDEVKCTDFETFCTLIIDSGDRDSDVEVTIRTKREESLEEVRKRIAEQ